MVELKSYRREIGTNRARGQPARESNRGLASLRPPLARLSSCLFRSVQNDSVALQPILITCHSTAGQPQAFPRRLDGKTSLRAPQVGDGVQGLLGIHRQLHEPAGAPVLPRSVALYIRARTDRVWPARSPALFVSSRWTWTATAGQYGGVPGWSISRFFGRGLHPVSLCQLSPPTRADSLLCSRWAPATGVTTSCSTISLLSRL